MIGRLRRLAALGLGAGALVAGHVVGYVLAVPDPQHRHDLLHATGHGYLATAGWVVAVLGVAGGIAGMASGYRSRSGTVGVRRVGLRLACLLAGSFVALEVLERFSAGAELRALLGPILVVGVAIQVAMGFVVALLLTGLERIGETLRPETQRPRAAATRAWPLPTTELAGTPDVRTWWGRAPPVRAVS